jgi:anthranilate/para-aminobenzoate synthase component II
MPKDLVLAHVGYGTGRHAPFDQVYKGSMYVKPDDIANGAEVDAVVIWGGEDISPSIYGEKPSKMCGAPSTMSERDRVETSAMLEAIDRNIPIIGVCRGAQLACAVAGGRLAQHVDGHGGSHRMDTFDGQSIVTSSVHHQMMIPFAVDHTLIAWADKPRSQRYIKGDDSNDEEMAGRGIEPEIVWFPKIKALAIQGHPEFMHDPDIDPFVQYCMGLVRTFILGEKKDADAS